MSETKPKCKHIRREGLKWHRYDVQCSRFAVTEDGYCKTHDPEIRAQKDAAKIATWQKKWGADEKKHRLERAAPALLAALKSAQSTLEGIRDADPSAWGDDMKDQFEPWAKNRARHALSDVNGAIKAAEDES